MNLFDLIYQENPLARDPINQFYRELGQLTLKEIREEIKEEFGVFRWNVYLWKLHEELKKHLPAKETIGEYGVSELIKSEDKVYWFRCFTPKVSKPVYAFDMIPKDIKERMIE